MALIFNDRGPDSRAAAADVSNRPPVVERSPASNWTNNRNARRCLDLYVIYQYCEIAIAEAGRCVPAAHAATCPQSGIPTPSFAGRLLHSAPLVLSATTRLPWTSKGHFQAPPYTFLSMSFHCNGLRTVQQKQRGGVPYLQITSSEPRAAIHCKFSYYLLCLPLLPENGGERGITARSNSKTRTVHHPVGQPDQSPDGRLFRAFLRP